MRLTAGGVGHRVLSFLAERRRTLRDLRELEGVRKKGRERNDHFYTVRALDGAGYIETGGGFYSISSSGRDELRLLDNIKPADRGASVRTWARG